MSHTYDDFLVDVFGERDIFVLRLQRERVSVQPVNQRLIEAKANIRHLRSMDVSVDEAWK